MTIDADGHVALSSDVVLREVGDEMILLHMSSENYYGLDRVGRQMITGLLGGATVGEVARAVSGDYDDVDDARVLEDVQALVGSLLEIGLVRVVVD